MPKLCAKAPGLYVPQHTTAPLDPADRLTEGRRERETEIEKSIVTRTRSIGNIRSSMVYITAVFIYPAAETAHGCPAGNLIKVGHKGEREGGGSG